MICCANTAEIKSRQLWTCSLCITLESVVCQVVAPYSATSHCPWNSKAWLQKILQFSPYLRWHARADTYYVLLILPCASKWQGSPQGKEIIAYLDLGAVLFTVDFMPRGPAYHLPQNPRQWWSLQHVNRTTNKGWVFTVSYWRCDLKMYIPEHLRYFSNTHFYFVSVFFGRGKPLRFMAKLFKSRWCHDVVWRLNPGLQDDAVVPSGLNFTWFIASFEL